MTDTKKWNPPPTEGFVCECGESPAFDGNLEKVSRWRWLDGHWQHFHGYPIGHVDVYRHQPQPDEKNKILTEFSRKISNQKNLHPKYQKLVSEHFWELIDVTDEPQPDDLVDALIDVGVNLANSKLVFGDIGIKNLQKAEEEIRTLLQSRRPSITREEIESVIDAYFLEERVNKVIKLLKSKDIEVKGEK